MKIYKVIELLLLVAVTTASEVLQRKLSPQIKRTLQLQILSSYNYDRFTFTAFIILYFFLIFLFIRLHLMFCFACFSRTRRKNGSKCYHQARAKLPGTWVLNILQSCLWKVFFIIFRHDIRILSHLQWKISNVLIATDCSYKKDLRNIFKHYMVKWWNNKPYCKQNEFSDGKLLATTSGILEKNCRNFHWELRKLRWYIFRNFELFDYITKFIIWVKK